MVKALRRLGGAGPRAPLAFALVGLGILVTAQAGAQALTVEHTSRSRPALARTVEDLQAEHDQLISEISSLRAQTSAAAEVDTLRQRDLIEINNRLAEARLAGGITPLQGSGGYVDLGDGRRVPGEPNDAADYRVSARDIRTLVDGLWLSGAEGIAVGGQRVVISTPILEVGDAVWVNSSPVTDGSGRYMIAFVGPGDVWTRLSALPTFKTWMEARYGPYHLVVEYVSSTATLLPGYAGKSGLRWGQASPQPSGGD
jgi:uncharacterized protein YlxW (UPF0749 family)